MLGNFTKNRDIQKAIGDVQPFTSKAIQYVANDVDNFQDEIIDNYQIFTNQPTTDEIIADGQGSEKLLPKIKISQKNKAIYC
ncbi:1247_t:CDS:2 [Gigaspora rosea]|nr:1247_t:CDS:2 [Gigaspora rosea]